MTAPRFITLEGGEGAGKSTQIKRLAARLIEAGHKVTVTREPGGSPGAEAIRALLVSGDTARWTPLGETLLHFAARQEHLEATIRPALARGDFVLCDRFVDSTFAYQGAAQGLDSAVIEALAARVIGDTMPALTLILDLPVAIGLARAGTRGGEDRYERMGVAFHETLRQTFLARAKADPARCKVIDASGNEDTVAQQIWHSVTSYLPY
ncbi:MAG: dTMP kinase [Parvibaculaceae bacterium]